MKDLRRWFTLLNLHLTAAAALAVLVAVLAVKVAIAFHDAGKVDSASYQQQLIQYVQLRARMAHLQDLPQKVDRARDQEDKFTNDRIAPHGSTIDAELGSLAIKNQIRLARAQYTFAQPIDGITEVRVDAALSGDYIPIMHFINDIERDKNHVFFIIDGVTFTGQQGGLVNLRLRLSTYLQAGATDLPPSALGNASSSPAETAVLNPTAQGVR